MNISFPNLLNPIPLPFSTLILDFVWHLHWHLFDLNKCLIFFSSFMGGCFGSLFQTSICLTITPYICHLAGQLRFLFWQSFLKSLRLLFFSPLHNTLLLLHGSVSMSSLPWNVHYVYFQLFIFFFDVNSVCKLLFFFK